ncbi:MAG: hypothetical protein LAT51_12610 [Flavobacteriaceae bacterium]|nr:hypothetical protein [Flavobacteriaceae bacterium]
MSLKDKKYKRVYRTLFWIVLLLGVASSIYLAEEISKLEIQNDEEQISLSAYQELEEEIEFFQDLMNADNYWIYTTEVEKAKENYNSLLDKAPNSSIKKDIERRIQNANDWINARQDDDLDRVNLRRKLSSQDRVIDSLKTNIEDLQLNSKKGELSIERKFDSLSIRLKEKEEELKRQKKVQVISFKNDNGNLIHYIGEINNEMANGGGIGIWDTGSVYKGDWVNNKRNGKGEFKWKDGAKYEGDFIMGERTGNGVFYYNSGERYEGEFKKGLRHGKGVLFDKDGNKGFEGNWKNDQPIQK